VLCHADQIHRWLSGLKDPYPLEQLASGVDLFFVISGFVMVYSSRDLFAAKGAALTFFTRRVARIVPPYWTVMVVAIPLMSLSGHVRMAPWTKPISDDGGAFLGGRGRAAIFNFSFLCF
jgi:peptidoglycan/LPS O-acetylase OafA/YrhL